VPPVLRQLTSALVLTLLATVAVVALPTVTASAADPHPVAPRIHTIALVGVDATALSAARRAPAAVADSTAAWTRDSEEAPAVLTGQLRTPAFSAVGVTWRRPAGAAPDLRVAVRTFDGSWQPWTTLEADADVPSASGNGRAGTDPYFAGPSTGVQVRVDLVSGRLPADLRVDLIDPGTSAADAHLDATAPSTAAAATSMPQIVTRAQWGADESLRSGSPVYDSTVKMAFIHHTASSNSYTKAQAPAAVRSIYAYDTEGLGWSDIAYNVIVDKYGQIFEGRAGGLARAVRSAATGGFNPSTFSVSALGTYTSVAPSAAMLRSMERILAWKLGLYHVDPQGKVTLVASSGAGTTSRFPDGTAHTFNAISGHRDAGLTQCPGNMLYAKLPAIRSAVAKMMGAAILSPHMSGYVLAKGSAKPVTLTAKALAAQHWQLQVANPAGHPVRTITGTAAAGGAISAAWDGTATDGERVPAGVYSLSLTSWTSDAAAVPFLAKVAVDPDPDTFEPGVDGSTVKLQGLGYGHGRGMSQFGAAGAAIKGLTAAQILAFYYPGTTLETAPSTTRVRVDLLGRVRRVAGAPDVRVKASPGLFVSDATRVAALPSKLGGAKVTVWRARLNSHGHLDLYGVHGSTSTPLKGWTGLSGALRFTSTPGKAFTAPPGAPSTSRVSVYDTAGRLRTYRGTIEATPDASGTSLAAVSDVRLDDYVRSVVSAELPGGWEPAAYQAQAVAARSYALYKSQHAPASARWDLVDSTADQVYGGYSGETSPEAAGSTATAGEYLAYRGKAAFAQYSSADGGWTEAGSQPYLVAKADPYDAVLTGSANWGHSWSGSVRASSVQAAWPSVGALTSVTASARDGHGSWGGRVTQVTVVGRKGQVTVSGVAFRTALGLRSDWWRVVPTPAQPPYPQVSSPVTPVPPSTRSVSTVPTAVTVVPRDRSALLRWAPPASSGNSAITEYQVRLNPGARSYRAGPTARSLVLPALINGSTYTVTIGARNALGLSATVTVRVTPGSAWSTYVPLPTPTLATVRLKPGVATQVRVSGTQGIPSTLVGSVWLLVSTGRAAAASTVTLAPSGQAAVAPILDLAPGSSGVASTVVAPGRNGSVTLVSPRALNVRVRALGYATQAGAVGQRLVTLTPTPVRGGTASAASPLSLPVASAGVPSSATGVLLALTARASASTTLQVAGSAGGPFVPRLVLPAGATQSATVFAPLTGGAAEVAAGGSATVSAVVLGYYLPDDGRQALGRFRSLAQPVRVVDTTGGSGLVAGKVRHLSLLGQGGLPVNRVRALLLQVDVLTPTSVGFLSVGGHGDKATRVLAYQAGHDARTLVVVRPGTGDLVDLIASRGRADVAVEALGWWAG